MKYIKIKLTLLVLLLLTAAPISALTIPIGTLETKYIIISENRPTIPGVSLNYGISISALYGSTIEGNYEISLANYSVEYAMYTGKRKIIWAPPVKSSKFIPQYNESVYLPEDLKKIVKEIAESSDTVAEFAWRVSWFVHKTITYEDVSYITELGRVIFTKDETNWLINEIWEKKKGVCRHKAILTQQMFRYAGINAEYVGGYVLVPVGGSHKYIDPSELNTIPELVQFSTHTGLGHAWVIVNDPEVGWYPIDPTRQRDPLHPIIHDNIAVYVGNYTPFAPDEMPLFRLESVQNYTTNTNEVRYKGMKIIESSKTGIVVYNPKDDQIDYYPGGYALIIPQSFNWSYERYFQNTTINTNITIIHRKGKYYVKIDGIDMPLYFTNGGKIVKPLYKKGEYYVYREHDIPIIDEKASFKTPYHLLRVEVKEDIFIEIPGTKIPNFLPPVPTCSPSILNWPRSQPFRTV